MKLRMATVALATMAAITTMQAAAQDGGSLYKTKCAMCHGDAGQGKASMGSKLAGTAKSEAVIEALLTKGGAAKPPHVKPLAGLTTEQAASIALFVKTLK
jgi:mono/diheme cytochrome c family protein